MPQRGQAAAGEASAQNISASDVQQADDSYGRMVCLWNSNQLGVAYLDQATGHVRHF